MPLNATQFIDFSGVDSRSNPLALPYGKFLRLRNAKVTPDHHLELREGYTQFANSTIGAPIHSMTGFDLISGGTITRNIVFAQGNALRVLNMQTGAITLPAVRGAAIASSNPWSFAVADDGKLYAYNGTDKKFFDGITWRDSGLRAPTPAEVAGVVVAIGAADPNGIPASTVGGAQPGYQLYLSLYNPTTGAVSNCIKIGPRFVNGVACDINISGLPNYAGIDTEWVLLVGRTVDGGVLPYVIDDTSGNWIYVPNGNTSAVITQSGIDNNAAMPQRSDLPQAFDKVARVGARFYGNTPNSPTIWKSQANYDATIGKFVGKWEQCFSADDIETFPTGEPVLALKEYAESLWVFAKRSMAILVELPGSFQWQGPWAISAAGQEAFCKSPYGPIWLNDRNQLCTMTQDGPISISGAYERALLAKIGASTQSRARVVYECDVNKDVDRVVVKALDNAGNPFQVYHDFKLRNASSIYATTYAWQGEAYDSYYLGPLANDYIVIAAHDGNGIERLWAGDGNGNIYQLSAGGDDMGNQFTADGITLINAGPERPTMDYIEWYGDGAVGWSVAQSLNVPLASYVDLTPSVEQVPDGLNDYQYRVSLKTPELKHIYVRIQLTSHSADLNALQNSGFESGGNYWSAGANIVATSPHSGTKCLEMTTTAQVDIVQCDLAGAVQTPFPVHPGQLVIVSGWINRISGTQAGYLVVPVYDKNGTLITSLMSPSFSAANGTWQYITQVFAMPAGAASIKFACEVHSADASSVTFRFDDLSLFIIGDGGFSGLNDPPHVPLETYGRIYMVDPLVGEPRGHTA